VKDVRAILNYCDLRTVAALLAQLLGDARAEQYGDNAVQYWRELREVMDGRLA
jgi:hypothetical protein